MKTLFVCILLMAALALTAAADASGKWSGSFAADSGENSGAYAILKQTGGVITGSAGPDENQQWEIQKGKIEGNRISLEVKQPDSGAIYKVELTMSGDTMKGDIVATMPDGNTMKGKMELSRVK